MKLLKATVTIAAILMLALGSASACPSTGAPSSDDDFSTGILNTADFLLYNDPVSGETDSISLFAVSTVDSGLDFQLEYHLNLDDNWYSFDHDFGTLFGNVASLATFDSASGAVEFGLRLTDGDGNVISQSAEAAFHSLRSETDDFRWFNWVAFDWLDDAGNPLDITTMLTAGLPWDTNDTVGHHLPISSTGIYLGFGLLFLLGRRSRRA
jgi:hypothetical protein